MTRLRPLLGLVLTGYGLLILARLLAHESILAGALSLCAGLALLVGSVPRLEFRRARLVAVLGAGLVGGVIGYNALAGSGLAGPEWALVLYGLALLSASFFLSRDPQPRHLGSVVAWSFPLLLAPLILFALNAALSSPGAGAAASPLIVLLIVLPTVLCLRVLGMDVQLLGKSMIIPTERGILSLDVGLVCAGLYPMVLFGGLVALHAWREGMPWRRGLALVASGLAGLWALNLLRLVALTHVGARWGPEALQQAHAHLGWILFAGFMAVFWALALRGARPVPTPAVRAPWREGGS